MKLSPWAISQIPFDERIKMNTVVDEATGCHIFIGRKDGKGYGQIKSHGKQVLVHRWLWMQAHGQATRLEHVLHSCDNPACVNIDHLFLGDHRANMIDKAVKGRAAKKLSIEKVQQIKRLIEYNLADSEIASKFDVDRKMVSHIRSGVSWNHVKC